MKNAKKEYNRAGYSVGIVFFLVYHTAKRKGSMHMELMYTSTRNASDKPEHCFRNAKIAKKFDLTANFSEFLNSFRFLGMILLLSHPERQTFQSSFSLVSFTFVCISRSFNFIYKTIIFQKSSK